MDDKTLRQHIIDELEFEPSIEAAHIGVAVEDSVVTLTGHVASYAEKVAAERAVQRVKGVKALALEVQVRYPFEAKTDDDQLAKRAGVTGVTNAIEVKPHAAPKDVKHRIMAALHRNAQVEANNIQISVKDGKVTLHGTVKAWYERGVVERAAWSAPGVTQVEDNLKVS